MYRFAAMLAVLATAILGAPQAAADPPGTTLDSLVAAEKAFSARSVDFGMKDAFLVYLADDGILFRPGPVNGRSVWAARRNPPGTLIWEPSYAEVSALGDIGLSTGPWEYRPPADDSTAAVDHGHFVSIWRRTGDADWKLAVDIGISHPKPEMGVGSGHFEAGPQHALPPDAKRRGFGMSFGGAVFGRDGGLGVGIGQTLSPLDAAYRRTAHEVNRMMNAERTLAFELKGKGPDVAYPKVAAADVRAYREGAEPVVGITPAIALAGPRPRALEFRAYGKGLSGSYDFGYSYGIALRTAAKATAPDTSGYLHVWRRDPAGQWKLTLDVESPYPKR
jgi:ketosteroid isomerase-like protein